VGNSVHFTVLDKESWFMSRKLSCFHEEVCCNRFIVVRKCEAKFIEGSRASSGKVKGFGS